MEIDWNELWKEKIKIYSKNIDWDSRAKKFNKAIKCNNDYSINVLKRIKLDPEWSVLDVGCGPGTLAIPIAKEVKHVTAVDISKEMLKLLKKNAEKEGISNINIVNADFKDIDIEKIKPHDVVIASRFCGLTGDLKYELKKLDSLAKKYVYITSLAQDRKLNLKIYKALGKPIFPTYIFIYNVLYQLGIFANVEIFDSKIYQVFKNIDEAVNDWKWFMKLNKKEEKILRNIISSNLKKTQNGFIYQDKVKWALIWWRKL
nr:methyltransferase domain-containing protein [Methanothermus fervidus]